MPVFNLTINFTEDGQPLPGFPIVQSKSVPESQGKQTISRPDDTGVYTELPLGELGVVSVLYVTADQPVALRFNDQTDGDLPLNAGGIMLLFDGNIPDTATLKAALENDSGSVATVTVISGGS